MINPPPNFFKVCIFLLLIITELYSTFVHLYCKHLNHRNTMLCKLKQMATNNLNEITNYIISILSLAQSKRIYNTILRLPTFVISFPQALKQEQNVLPIFSQFFLIYNIGIYRIANMSGNVSSIKSFDIMSFQTAFLIHKQF